MDFFGSNHGKGPQDGGKSHNQKISLKKINNSQVKML